MNSKDIIWEIQHFNDLEKQILYDILKLRVEVFVVEQKCPYLEIDGIDKSAYHLSGSFNDEIIACGRIFFPGSYYENEASFGRIAVKPKFRGKDLGRTIVQKCMDFIKSKNEKTDIIISAQSYLRKFYEEYGFVVVSDEYDWDGIPHFDLKYKIQ